MQRDDFTLNSPLSDGQIPCTLLQHDSAESSKSLAVVPSVFGVDDTFLLHCKRFVEHGFRVYALDSFWRDCPGPLVPDEQGMEKAMARMAALTDDNCDSDVSTLIAYIRTQHKNDRLIALGICFGGRPVVRAAIDREVDGIAAWHGVRIGELSAQLDSIGCPMSLQFGAIDAWTPSDEIAQIETATADLSDVNIDVHPNCDHGFTHLDRPAVFNEEAYAAAFSDVLTL